MSNKTTLNVRGSYYNMTDEFYNPALELGASGLSNYWSTPWYSSLYNSGYVYYPALDVTGGTGTVTTNRLGRQGREWYQRPNAWTTSARMNWYQGSHSMKVGRGRARLLRQGGAVRADQPGVQLDADGQQLRQPRRRELGQPVGRPSCSARSTPTLRRAWCRCRIRT